MVKACCTIFWRTIELLSFLILLAVLLLATQTVCWADLTIDDATVPKAPLANLQIVTLNAQKSRQFAWGIYSLLYQDSDQEIDANGPASESVAIYGQTYKRGKAPAWGMVSEARCSNTGGCYGMEVDVVGLTAQKVGDHRAGIFLVGEGDVGPGIELYGPFVRGVQLPSGSAVNFDGGRGDAEVKFDPQTGYVGFWNARRGHWIAAWNADTGNAVVNGNPE